MPSSSLHVAGTGSFAAEVVDFATRAGMQVEGLIEMVDRSRVGATIHGLPVIAPESPPQPEARAVIGMAGERTALWAQLSDQGWTAATVIHPLAAVSSTVEISPGCVIGPLVVIGAKTVLGHDVLIGRGSLVGHHVTIGDGVAINPGANIGGNTRVGDSATIGIGATIVDGLMIGERAVVAAGACVVRDVAVGTRVQGVPARTYPDS